MRRGGARRGVGRESAGRDGESAVGAVERVVRGDAEEVGWGESGPG